MPVGRELNYESVLEYIRTYRNGHREEVPYDANGVVHLMLAAVENLSNHWIEGDCEQLYESASDEQREAFARIAKCFCGSTFK